MGGGVELRTAVEVNGVLVVAGLGDPVTSQLVAGGLLALGGVAVVALVKR
jgi:hypothetical protein